MNKAATARIWSRAVSSTRAAELLIERGNYPDAVSRAYYAVFYAALAAMSTEEIPDSKTHRGTIHLFREHLIGSGKIEEEWGVTFSNALVARQVADYDILSTISADEAATRCADCREFVERIYRYITDVGASADELESLGDSPANKSKGNQP